MGKTYYEILGVEAKCSFQEIAQKFRVLALTYHPDKNPERMAQVNFKFCQICEAFEVLSVPELREAYDRYGEKVLKNGIPGGDLMGQQAYRFSGDAFEIFENFFGTANPHSIALDDKGRQIQLAEKIENDIHKEAITARKETHAADLTVSCECTLEEFFMGSSKIVEFECSKLTEGGQVTYETVEREVEIKPGMKDGTKLFFPGEGNRPTDKLKGDLTILLTTVANAKYRREGHNLVYKHDISLLDALTMAPFEFKTLDGTLFKITPDEIVSPESTRVFKGQGMPILNNDPLSPLMMNHTRGDFLLQFNILFPQNLASAKKD